LDASTKKPLPFGNVLCIAEVGVLSYSSDCDSVDHPVMLDRKAYRHSEDGIYTGYKWQCVEFVRRSTLINKGYVFEDIAMALDVFRSNQVRHV
jgi:glutathionylspermidine amidase/synthetase